MTTTLYTQYLLCGLFLGVCIAQAPPAVLLQGRFLPGRQGGATTLPQTISWTSSSIFVSFEGASTVNLEFTAAPVTNTSYGINWLRFFIDNQTVGDGFTSYKKTQLSVAIPVSSGRHTLRIAKLSDPAKGEAILNSIRLSGGSFVPPDVPPSLASNRRMLVLGDSYTVGYGDAGAAIPNTCKPSVGEMSPDLRSICQNQQIPDSECQDYIQILNGNSLAAFATVAADALTADYQVLATSGGGFVGFSFGISSYPNYDLARIQTILPSSALLFNRTVFSTTSPTYDLKSWIPQVVVVASGTNDWYTSPPELPLQEWLKRSVSFLQQISDSLNTPTIIVQVWSADTQSANSDATGSSDALVANYLQAMPALVREANNQGLQNVKLLALNAQDYGNIGAWCGGHPSAVAHRSVARQLVAAVQKYFPDWTVANPVSLSVDQQAIRPNLSLLGIGGSPPSQG